MDSVYFKQNSNLLKGYWVPHKTVEKTGALGLENSHDQGGCTSEPQQILITASRWQGPATATGLWSPQLVAAPLLRLESRC